MTPAAPDAVAVQAQMSGSPSPGDADPGDSHPFDRWPAAGSWLGHPLGEVLWLPALRALSPAPPLIDLVMAPEPTLYCDLSPIGLQIAATEHGVIRTLFLYLEPAADHAVWPGPLADGVVAGMSRAAVRALGGPPSRDEGSLPVLLKPRTRWDRYDRPGLSVHFTYGEGEAAPVQLITLMLPDAVPKDLSEQELADLAAVPQPGL